MSSTVVRSIIIIAICSVCTFAERLFPFVVFGSRRVPKAVRYLGAVLPPAVIATLVVYCLRSVSFSSASGFVPSLISVAVTATLHLIKGNTLLSVGGGTACYMILVQNFFN